MIDIRTRLTLFVRLQAPDRLTSGEKEAGTHGIRCCVVPKAGLDALEKRKIIFCAVNRTKIPRSSGMYPSHYTD